MDIIEPVGQPKTQNGLMGLLETDPDLSIFFSELQDVLLTDPDFVLTIRNMARRMIPDSIDERIEDIEARISVNVSQLVQMGLLQARRYKTEHSGDYLPTYVATGL
jgi:maltooligosyltrehalose synthase